ncbi:MAG: SPFH domain-containing protein [bacterium]
MNNTTMIIITASVLLILALIPMLRKKKTILNFNRNRTANTPTQKKGLIDFVPDVGSITEYWKYLIIFTLLPSLLLVIIAILTSIIIEKPIENLWSITIGFSFLLPIAILKNGYSECALDEVVAISIFGGKKLIVVKGGPYFKTLFMKSMALSTNNIPFDFGQIETHNGEVKDWAAITTATPETCDWDAFKKYWISDYLHDIENPTQTDNDAAEKAYYKRFGATDQNQDKDAQVKTMMEKNDLHKQITFGPKVFGLLKIIDTEVFKFIANVPGENIDEKKKNLIESVRQLTVSVLNTEFKKFTHAQLIILSQGKSLNKELENALDSLLSGGGKNNGRAIITQSQKSVGVDCILAEITKLGGSQTLHEAIDDAQKAKIKKQSTVTAAQAEKEKLALEGQGRGEAKKAEADGIKAQKFAEAAGDAEFIKLVTKQAVTDGVSVAQILDYLKYVKQSENKNATYILEGGTSSDSQMAMFASILDKALEKFKSNS